MSLLARPKTTKVKIAKKTKQQSLSYYVSRKHSSQAAQHSKVPIKTEERASARREEQLWPFPLKGLKSLL